MGMQTTGAGTDTTPQVSKDGLTYDVFVNDPPPQDNGLLPNGEPKRFSPQASTLIYGSVDAVLTDPPMTADQARALGDWVAGKGRKVTDIFITHGHGDHWFSAGLLAERFGARIVASAGTIAQMHASVAMRPFLWDKLYQDIPPTPVTAVTVPDNRFTLEGHDLVIVEVGHSDSDDTQRPARPGPRPRRRRRRDLQRRAHVPRAERGPAASGRGATRSTRSRPSSPVTSSAGHQNQPLDDDADRTIAETRQYLDDAGELLRTEPTAVDFFNAKIERYPNHLGRTILWVGARALYGVREHPEEDAGHIVLTAWL